MRLLITGGKGNIATIIKNNLHTEHDISNPSHKELDILDIEQLTEYLKNNQFDVLIHTAIIGGRRTTSEDYDVVYKNLLMFENLMKFADQFKMIINFDSAAIYDRETNILNRKESELFTIPKDFYGFSKYIIYQRSLLYSNIYNFRIFNIFHKNEEPDRFIKSCFLAKENNTKVTIFQDKYFDFVYESDFIKILQYYLQHFTPLHISNAQMSNIENLNKTINICYNEKYKLSDIAKKILPEENIIILSNDLTNNYSGNGNLLNSMDIHLDGLETSLHLYSLKTPTCG
jgi:nucleoside-diphosphate-sugar epimerase